MCGVLAVVPNPVGSDEILKEDNHGVPLQDKPIAEHSNGSEEDDSKRKITIETVKRVDITFDKKFYHEEDIVHSALDQKEYEIEKGDGADFHEETPFSKTPFGESRKGKPIKVKTSTHNPQGESTSSSFGGQDEEDVSPGFKENPYDSLREMTDDHKDLDSRSQLPSKTTAAGTTFIDQDDPKISLTTKSSP